MKLHFIQRKSFAEQYEELGNELGSTIPKIVEDFVFVNQLIAKKDTDTFPKDATSKELIQ